jgi:glycolate oxidase FAD binding subunit
MSTLEIVRPADAEELLNLVADAAGNGLVLEARGGGSKRDIGTPRRDRTVVELGALRGIVDYEPSELVLTARPSTPLAEVEALLDSRGQMLAFEPWDHGPLFGRAPGAATIGGIVAAAVAGSRRVSAGGARDHLLGFAAVSGRGETFKAGGKVVKNVTGYDVAKVMAGSWGQLAILTELTLKVVPRPRAVATIALSGLSPPVAIAAMAKAMGSRCSVAAAAHLPGTVGTPAVTMLRLEGFRESVELRAQQLREELAVFAEASPLTQGEAASFWSAVQEARPLAAAETLWRAQIAPSRAAAFAEAVKRSGGHWLCDWAGALVWVGAPITADIRAEAESCGGHAMLLRAPLTLRENTPARHPETSGLAALTTRLKQAFDPFGVLDPYRFK